MNNRLPLQHTISALLLLISVHTAVGSVNEHKAEIPVIKQFIKAAQEGEQATLERLHGQHSNLINYQDGLNEWSALHHATDNKRAEIIALLLSFKANVDTQTNKKNRPLHMAARWGGKKCY